MEASRGGADGEQMGAEGEQRGSRGGAEGEQRGSRGGAEGEQGGAEGEQKGRGRGRGKFIVIVLPTFAGLKATYNVLDLKITKKKKGKWKGSTSKKPLDVVVVLVI